jgi:hypothetical protein
MSAVNLRLQSCVEKNDFDNIPQKYNHPGQEHMHSKPKVRGART